MPPLIGSPVLIETAPAKINLTLEVLGRRADGYHELGSLVVFAAVGDGLRLDDAAPAGVTLDGPFAAAITGGNLVAQALRQVQAAAPHLRLGHIHLTKRLPVAAGIGGGSADAAAALRLIMQLNGSAAAQDVDWHAIVQRLGADVPVCLASSPQWMAGTGERLTPLQRFPALSAVLVNPLARVPADKTRQVFARLAVAPIDQPPASQTAPPLQFNRVEAMACLHGSRNGLQPAAVAVVPETGAVLAAIGKTGGCRLARMSGAGPTCFGLYDDDETASRAAAAITAHQPDWWVVATQLGGTP